jgi:ribosomal protein S18 acetylase RimI-like enzyme
VRAYMSPDSSLVGNASARRAMTIRPMLDADKSFVYRGLSDTNWQDIPDDQKTELDRTVCDKLVFDDFERFVKTELLKFKVFVAVSETNDQIGFISVGELTNPCVGLPYGAVLDLWAVPELRRQGIGSRLLDHALDYLRSKGYTHAGIFVSSSNRQAVSLYEKRGFSVDRVTLMKRLRP